MTLQTNLSRAEIIAAIKAYKQAGANVTTKLTAKTKTLLLQLHNLESDYLLVKIDGMSIALDDSVVYIAIKYRNNLSVSKKCELLDIITAGNFEIEWEDKSETWTTVQDLVMLVSTFKEFGKSGIAYYFEMGVVPTSNSLIGSDHCNGVHSYDDPTSPVNKVKYWIENDHIDRDMLTEEYEQNLIDNMTPPNEIKEYIDDLDLDTLAEYYLDTHTTRVSVGSLGIYKAYYFNECD